jgi:hypothetical protein
VKAVFEKLSWEVSGLGPLTINSVKHAILFTRSSHFLAVKPKKNWLDIEFILSRPLEGFPIHRTVKASKSKWAHFMRLESENEVDKQLMDWLQEAYAISD